MSHPSDPPHSSHVESRSRKALRSYIIQASTLLEIVLSGLVLIGLLLSFIPLLKWMPGLLFAQAAAWKCCSTPLPVTWWSATNRLWTTSSAWVPLR